jgi:hypothetical protein
MLDYLRRLLLLCFCPKSCHSCLSSSRSFSLCAFAFQYLLARSVLCFPLSLCYLAVLVFLLSVPSLPSISLESQRIWFQFGNVFSSSPSCRLPSQPGLGVHWSLCRHFRQIFVRLLSSFPRAFASVPCLLSASVNLISHSSSSPCIVPVHHQPRITALPLRRFFLCLY